MSDAVREVPGGVEIAIFCRPGAARAAVAGLHAGAVKIKVRAPAVDGKANLALIEFVAGMLDVPERDVEIARGPRSRIKLLRVSGVGSREVVRRLEEALAATGRTHATRPRE